MEKKTVSGAATIYLSTNNNINRKKGLNEKKKCDIEKRKVGKEHYEERKV